MNSIEQCDWLMRLHKIIPLPKRGSSRHIFIFNWTQSSTFSDIFMWATFFFQHGVVLLKLVLYFLYCSSRLGILPMCDLTSEIPDRSLSFGIDFLQFLERKNILYFFSSCLNSWSKPNQFLKWLATFTTNTYALLRFLPPVSFTCLLTHAPLAIYSLDQFQ